jgi:hypothetical protein
MAARDTLDIAVRVRFQAGELDTTRKSVYNDRQPYHAGYLVVDSHRSAWRPSYSEHTRLRLGPHTVSLHLVGVEGFWRGVPQVYQHN